MRYPKINKEFTYGFEIEGAFSRKLLDFLSTRGKKKNFQCICQRDGSVTVNGVPRSFENPREVQELAIGIFGSLKEMLDTLRFFRNGDNYLENSTCGLHIHIKPRDNRLRTRILDYRFIKHLQKWAAENLCPRVQERIAFSEWCHQYRGLVTTFCAVRRGAKYCFVRNHPQGTFEFRFFSPCKHKVKNVELFMREFFRVLAEVKEEKEVKALVPSFEEKKLEDVYSLSTTGEEISQCYSVVKEKNLEWKYAIKVVGRSTLARKILNGNYGNSR